MMEHQGIRWGYVFLRAPNFLNHEDRDHLMMTAVEMYLAGEDERNVEGADYEGRLYTEQRFELLGSVWRSTLRRGSGNILWPRHRHLPGQRTNRRARRRPRFLPQLTPPTQQSRSRPIQNPVHPVHRCKNPSPSPPILSQSKAPSPSMGEGWGESEFATPRHRH